VSDTASLKAAVEAAGLGWRGGFHPGPADQVPPPEGADAAGTLILLGFTGMAQWPHFAAAPEYRDGQANPLDRWSRRVVGDLAARFGARALYPFEGPPFLPFHAWARAAEPVFTSPLGLLIHPVHGLWHSYRGALAFADRLDLPSATEAVSPCDSCAEQPCLGACPVGAFVPGTYHVADCVAHVRSPAGTACLTGGCRARLACPVGAGDRYAGAQAEFHMRSFLGAQC
jgi:hypothetical protein